MAKRCVLPLGNGEIYAGSCDATISGTTYLDTKGCFCQYSGSSQEFSCNSPYGNTQGLSQNFQEGVYNNRFICSGAQSQGDSILGLLGQTPEYSCSCIQANDTSYGLAAIYATSISTTAPVATSTLSMSASTAHVTSVTTHSNHALQIKGATQIASSEINVITALLSIVLLLQVRR